MSEASPTDALFERICLTLDKIRCLLLKPGPPTVKHRTIPRLSGHTLYEQNRQLREEAARLCAVSAELLARCRSRRWSHCQGHAGASRRPVKREMASG
jgi:hypothetical protein